MTCFENRAERCLNKTLNKHKRSKKRFAQQNLNQEQKTYSWISLLFKNTQSH
uniref:Uncharacterized protein n=1 Tax=Tetranychus urticae TaxID=32264 RepID=T1JPX8_TETUR